MTGLEGLERMEVDNIEPQVGRFVSLVGVPATVVRSPCER